MPLSASGAKIRILKIASSVNISYSCIIIIQSNCLFPSHFISMVLFIILANQMHYRDPRVPPLLLAGQKVPGDPQWRPHNPFQPSRQSYIYMQQPRHNQLPLQATSSRDIGEAPVPNLLQKDAKGYLMNLPPQNRCRAVLTAINLNLFKQDSRGNIRFIPLLCHQHL